MGWEFLGAEYGHVTVVDMAIAVGVTTAGNGESEIRVVSDGVTRMKVSACEGLILGTSHGGLTLEFGFRTDENARTFNVRHDASASDTRRSLRD